MSTKDQEPVPGPARIEIEGDGIALRQFIPEDAQIYFDLLQRNKDFLSQQYEGGTDDTGKKYKSVGEVLDSILHPDPPDKLRFGIWDGDKMVGTINLTPDDPDKSEVGYLLDQELTGHGYMSRAVNLACGYAFESMRMKTVFAHVYVGNEDSRRVLDRTGFGYIRTFERDRNEQHEKLWEFERTI